MITLKTNNEVPRLEEQIEISQQLADFIVKAQLGKTSVAATNAYKNTQKDLGINHAVIDNHSIVGMHIGNDCDIQEKCKELVNKHAALLSTMEDAMKQESDVEIENDDEEAEGQSPVLKKWIKTLRQIKAEAAEEGVGLCVWLEDEHDAAYTGFISDGELATRILTLNMTRS